MAESVAAASVRTLGGSGRCSGSCAGSKWSQLSAWEDAPSVLNPPKVLPTKLSESQAKLRKRLQAAAALKLRLQVWSMADCRSLADCRLPFGSQFACL